MSWLDKVKNTKLEITTGDGVKYTPLWVNASKLREFNVAMFDFPNVDGTYVDRRRARGGKYDFELIFQGADHLVHANNFDESNIKSRKAWVVSHPYYGQMYVQPISLYFDNKLYNRTRISGHVMETIGAGRLRVQIDQVELVKAKKLETDALGADVYMTEVPKPKLPDAVRAKSSVSDTFNAVAGRIRDANNYSSYYNAYNTAAGYANGFLSGPEAVVNALGSYQALANAPLAFNDGILNRAAMLVASIEKLGLDAVGLTLWSLKKLYELQAGTAVGALALASVLPVAGDYRNRVEVVAVIEDILDAYNDYVTLLDGLQTLTGGTPDSYIPNGDYVTALDGLVMTAVDALYDIASGARQERVYELPEDGNVIGLAHLLYGLKADDSTVDQLIADNGIVGDELLMLEKGRKVVYYV